MAVAAAAFLVLVGLTGSILAFESDYDRWLHPSLWQVTAQGARMSEQALVDRVERQLPSRVEQIGISDEGTAQVFALTSGVRVFVDPYTGAILGSRDRPSKVEEIIFTIHQLHVRLLWGNGGEWIVDSATAVVLLLIPTGVYLWWDKKRVTIKWSASWRRINWDLHNVLGVYGCAFAGLLAVTGLLVAFETPLYWMVRSDPWHAGALPRSVVPETAGVAPDIDRFLAAADGALPGAETYQVQLPLRPRSPVQVLKRGPGLAGHSAVYLDRYSARVLRVDDLTKLPRAYRAHFINQAIHMGTIAGMPGKIVMSFASLLFVGLVVTGCTMWWQTIF